MKHLTLGPRARNAIRLVARFVNPLTLLVAGRTWMRVVGVIRHRGRKTGRVFATPLGMRRIEDRFVMPLTFGDSAAWYRNVTASGSCEVTYMGRTYTLIDPEVIDYASAAPAFPRYELMQFRFVGIAQYLRMRILQENKAMTPPRQRIGDHVSYVPDILGPLVVVSVGLGLIFFPTTVVAISGAARHESGLASAVLNVSQQLGGSIGLAVLGTVAANVTSDHLAGVRPTHALIDSALTAGFTSAFELGVPIALAGFVLALLVIRGRRAAPAAAVLPEAA